MSRANRGTVMILDAAGEPAALEVGHGRQVGVSLGGAETRPARPVDLRAVVVVVVARGGVGGVLLVRVGAVDLGVVLAVPG